MIQIIGVKRILILIILLAVNVALAAATYLYVVPKSDTLERQLRSTRSQVAQKRTEADQLRNEFDVIQEKKASFENLRDLGFISEQNRLVARRRIMDIQKYSRVIRANYNINPANISHSKTTDEIDHVILASPLTVNVEAVDDIDFYSFVYWMETAFPGHMSLNSLQLTRTNELNETTLRAIGSGSPIALMKGDVNMLWRTIAPKQDVKDTFTSEGF